MDSTFTLAAVRGEGMCWTHMSTTPGERGRGGGREEGKREREREGGGEEGGGEGLLFQLESSYVYLLPFFPPSLFPLLSLCLPLSLTIKFSKESLTHETKKRSNVHLQFRLRETDSWEWRE